MKRKHSKLSIGLMVVIAFLILILIGLMIVFFYAKKHDISLPGSSSSTQSLKYVEYEVDDSRMDGKLLDIFQDSHAVYVCGNYCGSPFPLYPYFLNASSYDCDFGFEGYIYPDGYYFRFENPMIKKFLASDFCEVLANRDGVFVYFNSLCADSFLRWGDLFDLENDFKPRKEGVKDKGDYLLDVRCKWIRVADGIDGVLLKQRICENIYNLSNVKGAKFGYTDRTSLAMSFPNGLNYNYEMVGDVAFTINEPVEAWVESCDNESLTATFCVKNRDTYNVSFSKCNDFVDYSTPVEYTELSDMDVSPFLSSEHIEYVEQKREEHRKMLEKDYPDGYKKDDNYYEQYMYRIGLEGVTHLFPGTQGEFVNTDEFVETYKEKETETDWSDVGIE